jgi:hypothetical protein
MRTADILQWDLQKDMRHVSQIPCIKNEHRIFIFLHSSLARSFYRYDKCLLALPVFNHRQQVSHNSNLSP